ncbi:endonuclease/exonuclease/phosphatase family protein [Niabella terrae]
MSYNIHHANPPSKPDFIDLDAVATVIKAQHPDIVALQEVDVHTARSGKIDEAALLAEKAGFPYYYFAKSIDHDGGDYGVALLSRFPLTEKRTHRLPTVEGTGGELRVIALAVITLPGGKKLEVASTHLDAQRERTNRLRQIEEIGHVAEKALFPLIIGGDFNAAEQDEVIKVLDKYFTRTCKDCAFTIPVEHPKRTLDYIGFRPGNKFSVLSHQVINETYASDHLPVVAVLQLLD